MDRSGIPLALISRLWSPVEGRLQERGCMRLDYYSLHARVFRGKVQAWHAYPEAKIQDLRALAALLRVVNARPMTLDVRARPCDHCAEAIRHICALVSGWRTFYASGLCMALLGVLRVAVWRNLFAA